ncbi:metallophosphoesterase [Ancylobacter sp. 6x-1]|uniref:Metallophosphoesterase n=1 Tax=Ancylobacter crimeensis TaxID=2579147 RepID=A0ABT0D6R7_9HYPH|nr:metallophosphoesterase [Ancylobacter crimeensis]MCK0195618.1 metallophosphoesterase [Ancylobacter crimeensis]
MVQLITRRTFLAGTTFVLGAPVVYGGFIEPMVRLVVTRYRPAPANWPADFPLRIAVLSDFHVADPWMGLGRVERIVAATNALQADIVLLLGDYPNNIDFAPRLVPLPELARRLADLKAPLGVWSILGNHDWWQDPEAQLTRRGPVKARIALEAAGIPVMENDVVRLDHKGHRFWLAGLGDTIALPGTGTRAYDGVHDLEGTTARIEGDEPAIMMVHEPDIFSRMPNRYALTLSGHTHGGQIRIAGWSPVSASRFGDRYRYGHIVEHGKHLIVNGGLGCSNLPVRIGVPPEIVLIELGHDSAAPGAISGAVPG